MSVEQKTQTGRFIFNQGGDRVGKALDETALRTASRQDFALYGRRAAQVHGFPFVAPGRDK